MHALYGTETKICLIIPVAASAAAAAVVEAEKAGKQVTH